ncbi:hypothetical protein V8B97DRAFT_1878600, partial [Scleroderma yunnanense]
QDHERCCQMYGLLVGSQVPMLCPGFLELYPLGRQVLVEVLVQCVIVEVELCKGEADPID